MDKLDQKLAELKKLHPTARHFCWASRMGHPLEERANDAGEPAHSAGTPILHALQSIHVEQSAVVVVRYFGGTKLGVPGLIAAYRSAAEMALEVAGQKEVHPMISGTLTVPYDLIGTAELHLRQCEAQIAEQTFGDDCCFIFTLKWAEKANLEGANARFTYGNAQLVNDLNFNHKALPSLHHVFDVGGLAKEVNAFLLRAFP